MSRRSVSTVRFGQVSLVAASTAGWARCMEQLRRRLYQGGLITFRQVPAAVALHQYFANNLHNPQHEISNEAKLFDRFESDEFVQNAWKEIIAHCGVHLPEALLWDRVRLRIQRSGDGVDDPSDPRYSRGRFSSTLATHRDTWANNVMQQLNWWTPLAPITAGRTLAIFPSYFSVPVANTSATWSLELLRSNRKLNVPYDQLPVLAIHDTVDLDNLERDLTPIVIDPGDVLIFSGAHLHKSVLNQTGVTRFSSEVRTVDFGDVKAAVGAKNIDGNSKDYNLQWFKPVT